jgi:hypothetical protein
MPIKCTITIDEDLDEYGETRLKVRVSQAHFLVQNSTGVQWKVVNNSGGFQTVKLRAFKNLTTPGNPADPCTNVTVRRKKRVAANGATALIEVDVHGVPGDTHKYNIHIGQILALDPELEIQP